MERHIDSAPGLIDGTADKGWTAISKETYPKWLLQFREGVRNELKWLVVARSPPRRREDSAWRSRGNENSFFPPFPPPHEKLPWGQPAIALENKNSRDGGTQNRKTNLALEMPDANNVTNPMKHFFFFGAHYCFPRDSNAGALLFLNQTAVARLDGRSPLLYWSYLIFGFPSSSSYLYLARFPL